VIDRLIERTNCPSWRNWAFSPVTTLPSSPYPTSDGIHGVSFPIGTTPRVDAMSVVDVPKSNPTDGRLAAHT
jgi:hypothetical protein